jgi:hypothetical protein
MMNQDQVMGVARVVIAFIGGILVTSGWVSATESAALTAALLSLVGAISTIWPIVWTLFAHTHTSMIQSVNAADNGVKVVSSASPALEVNEPIDMLKKGN